MATAPKGVVRTCRVCGLRGRFVRPDLCGHCVPKRRPARGAGPRQLRLPFPAWVYAQP